MTFATERAVAAPAVRQSQRWRWLAFGTVITAAVMDLLDSTIAQVAAPTIRRSLGGSYAVIEWVTASYTLAMAVGLLTGGRLGDLYGRRRVLLAGLAGFVVASAACAAAGSAAELIAARAAQGLLGSIMLPQVFGLIRDLFEEHEMGKAFGVYGPVMGLSAMIGPIAAGGLISLDVFGAGWRMIFLVNVPVGLAALAVGARILPAGAPAGSSAAPVGGGRRLDLFGALLAGVAMFLLVYPLAQGHDLGWPGWLFGMLAASVLALGGFGWYQGRKRSPLIELSVFAHRSYTMGIVFSIVFVASLGGIVMIFNVFLQNGLGYTPWHSAVTTAPWAAGAFIGSAAGGITMARLGRRVLHAGLIVEAAGLAGIYLVIHQSVGTLDLLAPMIIGGIGMGMVFVPLFDIVMAGVRPQEMGSASGILQTVNALGVSLGVAGIGAIFFAIHGSVPAARWTALATIGLLAVAFAVGFGLPRKARG
ncbi:MAG TPA: MFS transporter [Streptosporangiaceae bacterium]